MTRYGGSRQCGNTVNQRGTTLMAVLAVLTMLLIAFLAVLTYSLSRYSLHLKARNQLVARHLAATGVTRCVREMNKGLRPPFSDSGTAPNGGHVSYSMSAWGPYVLVFAGGDYGNQSRRAAALIGSSPPDPAGAAISVAEVAFPFVVAGNTRIRGDVTVGPHGMTTGSIRGESMVAEDFHVGDIRLHQSLRVPSLDTTVWEHYLSEMNDRRATLGRHLPGSFLFDTSGVCLLRDGASIHVENKAAFKDVRFTTYGEIRSVFAAGNVTIGGSTRLGGLIEIVSDGAILVGEAAVLDNVILLAEDSIVISDSAVFSGTAVSSKKIVVEEKCRLIYPSLLLVNGREADHHSGGGIVLSNTVPAETICFLTVDTTGGSHRAREIYQDTLSTVVGIIVSQSRCDLRGHIDGSVITARFRYRQPPTTYVNWVKDIQVNRQALTYVPVFPVLQGDTEHGEYRVLRFEDSIP